MGKRLERSDLATRVFAQATMHNYQRDIAAMQQQHNQLSNLLSDIKFMFGEHFQLSNDQRVR